MYGPIMSIQHEVVLPRYKMKMGIHIILMALCKTAVTPLLVHWNYCSFALSHHFQGSGLTRFISLMLQNIHNLTAYHDFQPMLMHMCSTSKELYYLLSNKVSQPSIVLCYLDTQRHLFEVCPLSHTFQSHMSLKIFHRDANMVLI